MTFDQLLLELQAILKRWVSVSVLNHPSHLKPGAVLTGKLRRGRSGEVMFTSPVLEAADVTFFVGVEELGIRSCFIISPDTFLTAHWNDEGLLIESSHATHLVSLLPDETVDEIERRRSSALADFADATRESLADRRKRRSRPA